MDRPENVNIQVSQLVDTFKSQQHDRLDDDKLFYGHLRKCRCCFMQLTQIRGPNLIHQWHCETFMAMTGLELSFGQNHSNYLCLNCIELLRIFTELKVAADGMQKVQNRYIEHHRQLFEVVAVKQEVQDENVDETQVKDTNVQPEDDNNNIIDDGPQRPDADLDQDYEAEEFNHNEAATDETEKMKDLADLIDEMPECFVELERLDLMTIAKHSANKRANDCDAVTTILSDDTDSSPIVHFSSCDLCEYETDSKDFLTQHIESQHKNTDKQAVNKVKCPIDGCNKTFKSKRNLNCHRYNVHSEDKTTCNQCGKIYKNKSALYAHQQLHNKKFVCKICDKSFVQKYHLIDHMETYHIENSNFKCTKCSKIFKSQHKLKQHQRNTHDVKKFKCDQCNAAFYVPYLLTDHVKVKHEGKGYHCSHPGCSKISSTQSNAARHLRELHKLKGDAYNNYYELITMR